MVAGNNKVFRELTSNSFMKYTGERLTTEFQNTFGVIEHLHRYAFATKFVKNKCVLDAACGEGYGSNILSNYAKEVTGVDIDEEAIEHAKDEYSKDNLVFIKSDIINIPIESNSIDCIVSFETIEHTFEQEKTIIEFKRILKEDGILIISSPSKENYQKRDPNNKFHLKELTDDEFSVLISTHFSNVEFYKQYFVAGSFIRDTNQSVCFHEEYSGNFTKIKNELDLEDKYYNIDFFNLIIASNSKIQGLNTNSIFDGTKAVNTLSNMKIINHTQSIRTRTKEFFSFPFFVFKKVYCILNKKISEHEF
jgi:ubiquinone/menaquinone biosynthesis C-methylase UbiE